MTGCILCVALLATGGLLSPAAPDSAPANLVAPTVTARAWTPPSSSFAFATPADRIDPWLAEDKLQHFAMSFATTAFAYAGARAILDPDGALITAGSAALLAGIGKEIHDARAGRWFSLKDLAWDAAGVALGLTFVHHIR